MLWNDGVFWDIRSVGWIWDAADAGQACNGVRGVDYEVVEGGG